MPEAKQISQLDIGDGEIYKFKASSASRVFNTLADALAAIQAGTVTDGEVFYIKDDGTSGYPIFIGSSASITTADQAGLIPPGMIIFCTDDSINDITALQVSYDNTDSGLDAETVQDAIDEVHDSIKSVDDKQDKTDNSLNTTSKTVVGGINEVNTAVANKAAKSEAIKNITRSGTTFTATRANGTTFTFTQQDNYCGYSSGIISRNIGTTGGLTEGIPSAAGNNLNNISWNSEYNIPSGSGVANMPVDTWGFLVTRIHSNGGDYWRRQDFYDMFSDKVWTRRLHSGSWTGWVLVGPSMPNYGAKASTYGASYTAPYNCVVYLICNTSSNLNVKVAVNNVEIAYFQINNGTSGMGGILLPAGSTLTTSANCSINAFPIT